ncbi:4-hydroxy-tetrahydrodipicolinate reductase [Spirochaetia bacterium]|nr:4-hydroxy-tetrahydrodipicolinate reductase [Spirochaetia bacterium]
MNIALIGYGKMGKILEEAALNRGHRITAVVEPAAGPAGDLKSSRSGSPLFKTIAAADFSGVDAALEFTRPGEAAENIKALAKRKIPVVAGSTGWYGELAVVKAAVEAAGSSLLWASNFSLGVNLFYRIAAYAASLATSFPEYDAGGWEAHHNQKADSPSGTAKTLAERVMAKMSRKKKAVWEVLDRPPLPEEFHYPSLRLGSLPGTHTLIFDSPADTIEITHTARNRDGLATGALRAVEWLVATPRQGVFTLDDVLADIWGD